MSSKRSRKHQSFLAVESSNEFCHETSQLQPLTSYTEYRQGTSGTAFQNKTTANIFASTEVQFWGTGILLEYYFARLLHYISEKHITHTAHYAPTIRQEPLYSTKRTIINIINQNLSCIYILYSIHIPLKMAGSTHLGPWFTAVSFCAWCTYFVISNYTNWSDLCRNMHHLCFDK